MKQFIIKTIGFGLIILLVNVGLGQYILYKRSVLKSEVYYPNIRWKDITEKRDQFDLLILGSSHAYSSLNPEIIDDKLNCNAYNMGSSSQGLITTSIILPTILQYQKPKTIILEVFWGTLFTTNRLVETCHNLDATPNLNLKFKLLKSLNLKNKLKTFNVPVRLNCEKGLLIKNTSYKQQFYKGKKQFFYKGFVGNETDSSFKINKINTTSKEFNVKKIDMKNLGAIKTIKDICDEADISLIIVSQPDHPDWIKSYSNYDELYNYMDNFCNSIDVPYYYMPINNKLNSSDFYDNKHTTIAGANKFTSYIVDKIIHKSHE